MAPARRTATTAAPAFRRNMSPLALATKPARSISAFISAETSVKYVGDPSRRPSAASIFPISSLAASPSTAQRRSLFEKHFRHAVHPRISMPDIWTSSVPNPSFDSSSSAHRSNRAVFPSLRALPLTAKTFMSCSLPATQSTEDPGAGGTL